MKQLLTAIALIVVSSSFSQQYEIPDCEKVRGSLLIIEGKVTGLTSIWNREHSFIYTINTIKVTKLFKGCLRDSIINIVIAGGTINDTSINSAEATQIKIAEKSIFYLTRSSTNNRLMGLELFEVYGGKQGLITYDEVNDKATGQFRLFKSIKGELFPYLKRIITKCTQQSIRSNKKVKRRN